MAMHEVNFLFIPLLFWLGQSSIRREAQLAIVGKISRIGL